MAGLDVGTGDEKHRDNGSILKEEVDALRKRSQSEWCRRPLVRRRYHMISVLGLKYIEMVAFEALTSVVIDTGPALTSHVNGQSKPLA